MCVCVCVCVCVCECFTRFWSLETGTYNYKYYQNPKGPVSQYKKELPVYPWLNIYQRLQEELDLQSLYILISS